MQNDKDSWKLVIVWCAKRTQGNLLSKLYAICGNGIKISKLFGKGLDL